MSEAIYLDNAATTRVDPRVVERMLPYLCEHYGNPASATHAYGWAADEAVEQAREQVAALIGCDAAELIWTSGATESNGLALRGLIGGVQRRDPARRPHVITQRTEHAAVLAPLRDLRVQGQIELSVLDVGADGRVDPQALAAALRDDTALVSVMWVNNETGVVQDVAQLAGVCQVRGVPLHVDAAQAAGKLPIDLSRTPLAALSLSAHKLHGPKGVGALFVRSDHLARLVPQQLGGSQERGLRAGTLPVHQIVGFGEACRIARQQMAQDQAQIAALSARLWNGLSTVPGVFRNGAAEHCIAHTLSIGFAETDALALIERLLPELALSTGAACSSTHTKPSPVLRAMGRSDAQALASLRFSLGRFNRADEIDRAIELTRAAVAAVRARPAAARSPRAQDPDCPMKRLRRRAQAQCAALAVE
jgi:cysteine desulfurase